MFKIFKKLSIGKKTVGFITILLSIVLSISIYSFYRIKTVSDEILDLDGYLVPIDDSIAKVDILSLESEVHFQKVLRIYTTEPIDQTAIDQELTLWKAKSKALEEEFTKTNQIIATSLNNVKEMKDGITIARLQALIQNIESQRKQFDTTATKTIEALKRGDKQVAIALEKQLDEQENNLDKLTTDIYNQVAIITEERSTKVVKDEVSVLWLSLESLTINLIAFILGIVVTSIITRRIVRSMQKMVESAASIAQGDLDVLVPVASQDELGKLAESFNHMAQELRTKEAIKSKFGQYIDPRVVETLLKQDSATVTGGEKQVMTVFFSDIVGFSTITEMLTPFGLIKLLNKYLTLASEPIVRHQGVIDKYIGDAVMSFWGPPFTNASDHARLACLASLEQFEQLEKLAEALPELLGFRQGIPKVDIRIGLCTGELIVGNIGSNTSKSFTAIGDTVNIAARLESANKQYGTRILMSEETYLMVKEEFETREIDNIIVMGKSQPVRIYELLAAKNQLELQAMHLRDCFEKGLAAYRHQDWDLAEQELRAVLEINALDKPAQVFLDRIQTLRLNPPDVNWDGVWQMTKK
jgi:adenylate cyclase